MKNALRYTSILMISMLSASQLMAQPCDNFTSGGLVGGTADTVVIAYCNVIGTMGNIPNTQSASGGSGGAAQYQWQVSVEELTWTDIDIPAGQSSSLNPNSILAYLNSLGFTGARTTRFRRAARRPECEDYVYSNIRELRVHQAVDAPGTFADEYVLCLDSAIPDCLMASAAHVPGMPNSHLASGGTQPLAYQWQQSTNQSSWTTVDTEPLPTICPPQGTRTYYRRGVRPADSSCPFIYSNHIAIYHVLPLQITLDVQSPECDNSATGVITVTDMGGNDNSVLSNFSYSIDGGQNWQNSNVFTNLAPGTYTIAINENETKCVGCYQTNTNCVATGTVTANPTPIIDLVDYTPALDCDATDRYIQITASGGMAPLQYSIDGINFQESPSFTGLSNGLYTVSVRNSNGTCEQPFAGLVEIDNPLRINITDVEVANLSDCNADDGSITITATGGLPPLMYSLDGVGFQASPVFNGLTEGFYPIYVKNADGSCERLDQTVEIQSPVPPTLVQVNVTPASDCGASDGSITVIASSFTGMEYTIDGGGSWQASPNFSGVSEGVYEVGVRNNSGTCPVWETVTVEAPPAPVIEEVIVVQPTDCDLNNGSITVVTSGGEGSLQFRLYSLKGNFGPWLYSNEFVGLAPDTYTIWVRNGTTTCPITWGEPIVLNYPPEPEISSVLATGPSDCGANDGSITISAGAGTGTFQYSIMGENGPWSNDATFSGLAPGSYEIWVRNSTTTCPVQWETPVVLADPPLPVVSQVFITNPSDCGLDNGNITVLGSGGTGFFQYSITGENGPWSNNPSFSALAPGMYEVWIRNSTTTCPVQWSGQAELSYPLPPIIDDVIATNPTDCGANDGTIQVAISSGLGLYSVSLNGPNGNWSDNTNFTGLNPGSYTVWVRNRNATCPVEWPSAVVLTDPPLPTIDAVSSTAPTDCGASDGSINISSSAGTGTFEYSISGEGGPWVSLGSFTGLSSGSYEIWVRNSTTTCPVEWPSAIVLTDPPLPTIDAVSSTDPTDCGASDGSINISSSAGTGTFQYSISGEGGPWVSSGNFTGLSSGSYEIWVRNSTTTCPVEWPSAIVLNDPPLPIIDAVSSTDPTDCGASDGSINISSSAGTGTFQYSISGEGGPWVSSGNFTGLSSGSYEIWVRNSTTTCPVEWPSAIVLTDPPLPTIDAVSSTNPTDCGASDGSINISSSAGTGTFEYSISGEGGPWVSSGSFTGLSSGSYEIWVRNSTTTCPVEWPSAVVLTDPPLPTIDAVSSTAPTDCGASDGSINISSSAGTGTFQYSISGEGGPWVSSGNFTGLSSGSYEIWVRNSTTTCPVEWPSAVVLNDPPLPTIDAVSSTDPTDCGASDGSINISSSAGTGTFEYSISGDGGPWVSSGSFTGLSSGSYEIWVRNSTTTCPVEWPSAVVLNDPPLPIIDAVSSTDPTDCGASDGSINISSSAGTGTFEYSISGEVGPWVSSGSFTGLSSGSYEIWVRNSTTTCPVEWPSAVVLTDPPLPTIDAVSSTDPTDCGASDGSINISSSAGTGTFEYSISGEGGPWVSSGSFTGLSSGSYEIWVRNSTTTCPVEWPSAVVLTDPPLPTIDAVSSTAPTDCGASDGSINISSSAGTGTFEYSISGEGGPWVSSGSFTGLSSGSYEIWVRNSTTTCPVEWPSAIVLNDPPLPTIDAVSSTDPTDCGASDGSINISSSAGTGTFEYSISGEGGPWVSSGNFTGLSSGSYEIWVRNSTTTCPVEWPSAVVLTDPPLPTIDAVSSTDPTDCGALDGSITIASSAGTGTFEYSISGDGGPWVSSGSFTGLSSGSYEIWVRNSTTTCPVEWPSAVVLTDPPLPIIDAVSSTAPTDCGASDGSITIASSAGTGTFEYSISGEGGPWVSSGNFTGLSSGSYEIWVRNSTTTCPVEWPSAVVLTDPPLPIIDAVSSTAPTDCGASDGSINISSSAGTGTFEYSISGEGGPWVSSGSFTGLSSGSYEIWVRNSTTTCPVEWPSAVVLTDPPLPTIDAVSSTDPTDCGASDGSINISSSAGTGTFQYSISGEGGPWVSSGNFTGLSSGSYEIWVRNSTTTCPVEWPSAIVLNDPPLPTIDAVSSTAPTDCGASDGSITIASSAGTGTFQYSISGEGGPWVSSGNFTGLSSGSYEIWVRNSTTTCPVEWPSAIVLNDPPLPTIDAVSSTDPTDCGASDGSINISSSAGTGTFQYSISGEGGPWVSSGNFTGLSSGSYEIWVRNSTTTCPVEWPSAIVLNDPPLPTIDAVSSTAPTDCGASDGSITIASSAGTGTFEYSISGEGGPWVSSGNFTGLSSGSYEIWVRNSTTTCPVEWPSAVVLTDPPLPTIDAVSSTDPTDCGASDGSINISSSAGTGTFQYSISGDGGPWVSSGSFTGLSSGSYEIWVRNSTTTCPVEWPSAVVLTDPPLPTILNVTYSNASDCDTDNGSISISANQVEYSIDGENWSDNPLFTGLPAGTYTPMVRNIDGTCELSWSEVIVITAPEAPAILSVASMSPSDCGLTDGSISITALAGSQSIEYTIDGQNWFDDSVFANLTPGTYNIAVRNSDGSCTVEWAQAVEVSALEAPQISTVQSNPPSDCNLTDASIVIAASGGTGSFEYSINGGSDWALSGTFQNLSPGDYNVSVRNENGTCVVMYPDLITISPLVPPVLENISQTNATDCDLNDASITLTATGGQGQYEYSISGPGGPWQPSGTFTGLAPGSYEPALRNQNGSCVITAPSVELSAPSAPSFAEIVTDDASDCDLTDGSITLEASGGQGQYEYSISGPDGPWQPSGTFTGLAPGSYEPALRNQNGSCVITAPSVELSAPSAPSFAEIVTDDASDCDLTDASITLTATGGQGEYEYSINGADGPWQPSGTFTGLAPGSYEPALRNQNGSCVITAPSVELSAPSAPSFAEIVTDDASDCDLTDGSITLEASGGEGQYEYSINGPDGPWQPSGTFTGLAPGSYEPALRNQNGSCVITSPSVELLAPSAPSFAEISTNDASDCDLTDGSITLEASGGQGQYEYSISGPGGPWQSSGTFTGLAPGSYEPALRNQNGSCVITAPSVELSAPSAPSFAEIVTDDASDCDLTDGSITLEASGGEGQYEYSISGPGGPWQSSGTFTGLAPGSYEPALRNQNGSCVITSPSVELSAPSSPSFTEIVTDDASDCDLTDGSITLEASGGEGQYEYSISGPGGPWQSSGTFTGLAPGSYEPAVRNQNGSCIITAPSVELSAPSAPSFSTIQPINASGCDTNDASITLAATGGQGQYEYSINGPGGPWQSSGTFTGLGSGTYTPALRNLNGSCVITAQSVELSAPSAPSFSAIQPINASGCDTNDASITLTATGGQGQYEYSINGPGGPWQSSGTFTGLASGMYTPALRNQNGSCIITAPSVELSAPSAPSFSTIQPINASGCDTNDASITLTATGGQGQYEYSINGPGGPWQPSGIFTDLGSGTYTPALRNLNGSCVITAQPVELSAPSAPSFSAIQPINASGCDTNDASITLTASGGEGQYEYSINGPGGPWQSSGTFTGLASGTYAPALRNQNGSCVITAQPVELSAPSAPSFSTIQPINASGCDTNDASITLTATGGQGQYEYSINGPGGPWQSSGTFTGLGSGTYTPALRNQNGSCVITAQPVELSAPSAPSFSAIQPINASGCDTNDASITLTATGGQGQYEYSISGPGGPWQSSGTFTGLGSGTYTPALRNLNGSCVITAQPVELSAPSAPSFSTIQPMNASGCDTNDASITLAASGGQGQYEYSINGPGGPWQPSGTFTGLGSGTYTPALRNQNGSCVITAQPVELSAPSAPSFSAIQPINASGCDTNDASITLTASGGQGQYEYSINGPGGPWQSSGTFTGLGSGTYTPALRNLNGSCVITAQPVELSAPSAPGIASIILSNPITCGGADGSIQVSLQASGTDWLFSLNNGQSWQVSSDFDNLSAGSYQLALQAASGACTFYYPEELVLEEANPPVVDEVVIDQPSSCVLADGRIILIPVGNPAQFQYSIDSGATWTSNPIFSQLAVGTYQVAIRYTDGSCPVYEQEASVLSAVNGLTFSLIDAISPSNCAQQNGEITLAASGGNGQYEYSIDNGLHWQSEGYFANLPMGYYQALARLSQGYCPMQEAFPIALFPSFAPMIQNVTYDDPSDCGITDGFIAVSVINPSAHLVYSLNAGQSWQSSPAFTNLGGGLYQLSVRDTLNGCEVAYPQPVSLVAPVAPHILSIELQQPTACQQANGSLHLYMADTTRYYEVSIDGGLNWWVSTHFSSLPPGQYQVLVRNLNTTCELRYPDPLSLVAPVQLQLDSLASQAPSACGAADGSIELHVSGADALFYSLDQGQSWTPNPSFEALPAGDYIAWAYTANYPDCIFSLDTIALGIRFSAVLDSIGLSPALNCLDQGGSILLQGPPGIPLQYSLDGGASWNSSGLFVNLLPGTYEVLIADPSLSCQAPLDSTLLISGPAVPTVLAINSQDAHNCEANDGAMAIFSAAGRRQQYSIDAGQSWDEDGIFDNLSAGHYALYIRDTLTGCTALHPDSIAILGTPPLELRATQVLPPLCPGETTGLISVLPSGGQPPYELHWTDGPTTDQRSGLAAGIYTAYLTDSRACLDSLVIELEQPEGFAGLSTLLRDTLLCQGQPLTLDLSFLELASVEWHSDNGFQSDSIALTLHEAGLYTLNLLTLQGCVYRDTFLLGYTDQSLQADFLMPLAGVVGEPVVLIDITWPVPEQISWIYDHPNISSLESLPTQQIVRFEAAGTYTLGLQVFSGECYGFLQKEIRIFGSRDSLELPPAFSTPGLIRSFEVFPNPNDGVFQTKLILTQAQDATIWLFREDGSLLEQRNLTGRDLYLEAYQWPQLPPGVYTALAQAGDSWVYVHVIIQ